MSRRRRRRRWRSICDWPHNCSCHSQWLAWDKRFAEGWAEQPRDAFLLGCAQDSMRLMLECVTLNCPDARVRAHAQVQLMHPIWRRPIEGPCKAFMPRRDE